MKALIILGTALLLTSCYNMVPLKSPQPSDGPQIDALIAQVKPGKEYRFGYTDGSRIEMMVRRIESDSVFGVIYGVRNKKVSIPTKDIISIHRKKAAVGKIVILTSVSLAAAGVIIALAQPVHISMNWK